MTFLNADKGSLAESNSLNHLADASGNVEQKNRKWKTCTAGEKKWCKLRPYICIAVVVVVVVAFGLSLDNSKLY